MQTYRITEAEQRQVVRWSQDGVPAAEPAGLLGRKLTELTAFRRKMRAEGLIPTLGRGPGPDWSAADVQKLYDLIDAGHGYAAIARRLKRSETAVKLKAKRLGYRLRTTKACLAARDIQRLLGLSCAKTVTRWIETYGLKGRRAGTTGRHLWRVQWDDLTAWLDDPQHWMAYDPARCTEPRLREHLIEIRAGQPGWLTPGQVAARYCVTHEAVKQWIVKGFIPAARYGNWWVRESDLDGWVPPCERSKAGISRSSGRWVAGKDQIVPGPKRKKAA